MLAKEGRVMNPKRIAPGPKLPRNMNEQRHIGYLVNENVKYVMYSKLIFDPPYNPYEKLADTKK